MRQFRYDSYGLFVEATALRPKGSGPESRLRAFQ